MKAVENTSWENLKNKNPWCKELFNEDTDKLIKQIYDGNKEFVHDSDKKTITDRNKSLKPKEKDDEFILSLLPKPYRGNLKDPKLVILSLNPGYKKRVKTTLFNKLDIKYQREFIETCKSNAFLESSSIISNEIDDILDNGYWRKQLEDLIVAIYHIKDPDILEEKTYNFSDVALIQFIPYASKSYDSWDKEYSLGTQTFTKDIIQHLVDETDALFLIMRAKKQWETLIGNNILKKMKDEIRFLFNKHPICQKISEKNLMNEYASIPSEYDGNQFKYILNKICSNTSPTPPITPKSFRFAKRSGMTCGLPPQT